MTKEELKKEAEELYKDWYAHKLGAISIIDVICKMAEPREKRIAEFEKENAELNEKVNILDNCDRLGDVITEAYKEQLTKARKIILRLYNAGRDVLMCRTEEKAYDNLSNAVNDKSIEQFLNSEVEK